METRCLEIRLLGKVYLIFIVSVSLILGESQNVRADDSWIRQKREKNSHQRFASASIDRSLMPSKYDYSHFSNGPRWVPRPRGKSLQRAIEYGLGSTQSARMLLRTPPAKELLELIGSMDNGHPRKLLWPVVGGKWGRGFGYVRKRNTNLRHNGVDVAAPKGAVIRAAADGIVAYSDNGIRGFGNAVLIIHPNGWSTLYAHNLRNTVQAGWLVKRGERIALVGSTGIARGPHLHFEFRDNGRLRNPSRFFYGIKSQDLAGPMIQLTPSDSFVDCKSSTVRVSHPGSRQTGVSPSQGTRKSPFPYPIPNSSIGIGSVTTAIKILSSPASKPVRQMVRGSIFRTLLWPVRGGLKTRDFHQSKHPGMDIRASLGTPVRAASDGLVIYAGNQIDGYGNIIILLHRKGWVTVYASNQENAVQAGETVRRGAWIAKVGKKVGSSEAHLHFELLINGIRGDPSQLLVGIP